MSTPNQVAVDLAVLGLMAREKAHGVVVTYGAKLQAGVKRHASEPRTTPRPGPGGPRLMTGDYNRSISRLTVRTATESPNYVGTNKPQGARLEFGFVGSDSKGRSYNQKPYPHFGPALDEIAEDFTAAVAAAGHPLAP